LGLVGNSITVHKFNLTITNGIPIGIYKSLHQIYANVATRADICAGGQTLEIANFH